MLPIPDDMQDLSAAEEFFQVLDVPFNDHVVRVNRLHILKRYHDYIGTASAEGLDAAGVRQAHREALARAHDDFVDSDAVTEKVFKVFQQVKGQAFIGLDAVEPLSES
jgi:nitrogenase-stabilizing/protective protein